MKLLFEKVEIRNFLSFGNIPTVFDYESGINIVTGRNLDNSTRNGVGKSSLIADSISFAIYGKPLRGEHINKDELVNELNKKNCEVSVYFKIGNDAYKVTRQIKPTAFTVVLNDEEIKFDCIKNTEKWLEDKIGISHTCFSNILVLNMNDTTPFLTMDAANKRRVIEDVMNMNVYGKIADVAKDNHLVAKNDLRTYENDVKLSKETLELATTNKLNYDAEREKFEATKKEKVALFLNQVEQMEKEKEGLLSNIDTVNYDKEIQNTTSKKDKALELVQKYKIKLAENKLELQNAKETLNKLEDKPHCPTCKIPTDNPIIKKYVIETQKIFKNTTEEISSLNEKIKNGENVISILAGKIKSFEQLKEKKKQVQSKIEILDANIKSKKEAVDEERLRVFTVSNIISDADLKKFQKKHDDAILAFNTASKSYNFNGMLRKILGEEGVRKFVISKILPFFNTKINHYLKIMGSDLTLKFNSNLEEQILTRIREERTYGSFSAGEKKRIDIAILMALMDLAKLQNSVDTNLLVLDEVLDTAMDNEGVESFLNYLKDGFKTLYPDKAVYIITHRNTISDDFYDRMVCLQKKDGFTSIDSIVNMRAKS